MKREEEEEEEERLVGQCVVSKAAMFGAPRTSRIENNELNESIELNQLD